MLPRNTKRRRLALLASLVLVISVVVVAITYHFATPQARKAPPNKQLSMTVATSSPTAVRTTAPTPVQTPVGITPTTTLTLLSAPNPANVLGDDTNPGRYVAGINWIRLGYPD